MSGTRRRLPRRTRLSGQSFNRVLPNLMTLLGLCIGLSSIRLGLDGRFGDAVVAIAASGVIDGLDGRLARLLKATSRFGAEFDSLADFLCFGIAPALVIYM
ncbi:MAG: CDP-diacylglycerol--serine O-phosphatidyltransferase, partial [Acidocella sp. 20-61-6]